MIPKQLIYQNKVESAAARSYKSNIAPQNGTGTYGAGDTIIINIPTRANLVTAMSENYLKFDISFTNGAAANKYLRWDSCRRSWFNSKNSGIFGFKFIRRY